MRKNYIAPKMEVAELKIESLMGVTASEIGYGGESKGGRNPESRRGGSVWDDDEDDWDY